MTPDTASSRAAMRAEVPTDRPRARWERAGCGVSRCISAKGGNNSVALIIFPSEEDQHPPRHFIRDVRRRHNRAEERRRIHFYGHPVRRQDQVFVTVADDAGVGLVALVALAVAAVLYRTDDDLARGSNAVNAGTAATRTHLKCQEESSLDKFPPHEEHGEVLGYGTFQRVEEGKPLRAEEGGAVVSVVGQGQNLKTQITQGQNLKIQTTQGQNLKIQTTQGQNLKIQITQGQNLKIQITQGQNLKIKITQGQNLKIKITQGQNLKIQTTQGQNLKTKLHQV
ncbi:hypothetical protein EYF80_019839 [Liparis tanakae]|uniref:Uncharacterized protein n=1 Tax=Liparis tanakae TaxID=230148 RepID=A0A4Z2HVT9_9TELE|nr:hypothetical protein EYF80_019839 [Liparis tanakae]